MKITYKNYILAPEKEVNSITLLKIVKKGEKAKESGTYEKVLGYFSKIEGALLYLLQHEINNKDGVCTLKEFIQLYKKEKEEIIKYFNL